jgi:hypothetical protein
MARPLTFWGGRIMAKAVRSRPKTTPPSNSPAAVAPTKAAIRAFSWEWEEGGPFGPGFFDGICQPVAGSGKESMGGRAGPASVPSSRLRPLLGLIRGGPYAPCLNGGVSAVSGGTLAYRGKSRGWTPRPATTYGVSLAYRGKSRRWTPLPATSAPRPTTTYGVSLAQRGRSTLEGATEEGMGESAIQAPFSTPGACYF